MLPMKTLKENSDSIKKRRHTSPRNNINSQKPVKQRKQNTLNKYYKSKEWKKLREEKIKECPLCEECLANDIINPATDVHHVIPFSYGKTDEERWQLLLDYTNLKSLCKKCHIRIHELSKQHLALM